MARFAQRPELRRTRTTHGRMHPRRKIQGGEKKKKNKQKKKGKWKRARLSGSRAEAEAVARAQAGATKEGLHLKHASSLSPPSSSSSFPRRSFCSGKCIANRPRCMQTFPVSLGHFTPVMAAHLPPRLGSNLCSSFKTKCFL